MLPTYTRLGTTTSVRRALRTREKFLILLLFATLAFVCFGGFFYLPDNFVSSDSVLEVYKKIQNAGPEIFIPAPPIAKPHHQHGIDTGNSNDLQEDGDNHISHDRNRLHAKIQGDWASVAEGDHLEKPQAKSQQNEASSAPVPEKREVENVGESGHGVADAPDLQTNSLPSGEDADPIARERRNKIREVSLFLLVIKSFFYNFSFLFRYAVFSIRVLESCHIRQNITHLFVRIDMKACMIRLNGLITICIHIE